MFWLEVALLALPMALAASARVRGNPQALLPARVAVWVVFWSTGSTFHHRAGASSGSPISPPGWSWR